MLRKIIPAAVTLCALWTTGALAQSDYPNKPIQMIVAFPPGGNTDLTARALAPEFSKILGQPVVIVNKGGAGGVIGSTELARAKPDGYTIGLSPNSAITLQTHLQKTSYTLDSFRFVCLTYDNSFVLMAGKDAPFKTFQEFLAFTKAKPNNMVYASGGPGSVPHLLMLDILSQINAEAVHIPFAGAGPMAQAILGGTVMAFAESPAIATANGLPILAAFSEKRIPQLPDVPTMKELGFDMKAFSAGGIIVPAGTPDAIVNKLNDACVKVVDSGPYLGTMKQVNGTARYLNGAQFQELFADDSKRNRETVRKAGMLAQ